MNVDDLIQDLEHFDQFIKISVNSSMPYTLKSKGGAANMFYQETKKYYGDLVPSYSPFLWFEAVYDQ